MIPSPLGEMLGAVVFVGGYYLMRLGRHLWKGPAS